MNTTTPEKCPVCKAVRAASEYAGAYKCGTMVSSSGKFHHTVTCHYFAELRKPLDMERDQLAERVRMLEAKLADRDEAAACAVIQDERRDG